MNVRPFTAVLSLLLATPAAAQGLDALMAPLAAPQGQDGQLAALAACLAGKGDVTATADRFTAAGWGREDDAEMGLIYLSAPDAAGLGVTLADNGAFCEVASDSIGTSTGNATVSRLAIQGQVMMDIADGPMGCGGYAMGGAVVEVMSTGQDPTCSSETTSAIRVIFGP